ncbi:hypothetical protein EDB81DRAFT_925626 [Dactylonectria macrodidyma]|uniref:DUF7514 domain-containing protein n=1 Tax=Dactylonectria macrodidyma TaxID=307937 RepID=A0A9P9JK69_9HYPO|nr:hypothetical protein EDB81DRAFT_925626 [Dactylonectria macrodidyma]
MFDALRKLKQQAIEAAQASLDQANNHHPNAHQQNAQQYPYGGGYAAHNAQGYGQSRQGNSNYTYPPINTTAPGGISQTYGQGPSFQTSHQPSNYPPQTAQQYSPTTYTAQSQHYNPQCQSAGQPAPNTHIPYQTHPANVTSPTPQASTAYFQWGNLINPDKTASRQFVLLMDAIFNFADTALEPRNTGILEPTKAASLFEAMNYADSNNIPKGFYRFAVQNNYPDPLKFQADAMAIHWRIFQIPHHTDNAHTLGLTREGFRAIILRDALLDPIIQWKRLNTFLAANHQRLINPETLSQFPLSTIPEGSLPVAGDPDTIRVFREREAIMSAELLQYQQTLMSAQNWKHQVTMDGLTPGYFTPNAWGGYQFHATGGMNW